MSELAPVPGRPEVPLRVITAADVRASVRRAKKSLEAAAAEIVWQIEMEAWRTLGYSSWTAMREAEYGGAAFMVPSKSRPEIVQRIKEIEVGRTARGGPKYLTDQEIADTAGVSRSQVQDDLNGNNKKSSSGQNVDPDDDVIDVEIVDDEPTIDLANVNLETGEIYDTPAPTGTAPAEPITTTCPTCHGTGKVTQ